VPNVSRMDKVERAMAHDDLSSAWPRTNNFTKLLTCFDFSLVVVRLRLHRHECLSDNVENQLFVAAAIESGSQTGAWRQ